jgi:uncharacterized membrane protein YdjX (TVP38/TMEM64 family)
METFFDLEALENFMRGWGVWGPIIYFLMQVMQVIVLPFPGNLLTMVGAVLFGVWPGFFMAYAANIVGSVIGFILARKLGRAVMAKIMGLEKFDKYMKLIGTESAVARTKILLILVVTLPFLPSDFMCLIVGVTPISFRAYILIVIACRPWGQLASALLGANSVHLPLGLLIPLLVVLVVICVVGMYFAPRLEKLVIKWAHKLTDRFRKGKAG